MSEKSSNTHDVYLSYSSEDKTWADAACAVLERNQIRCWIAPRDIAPGDELGAAIIKGINQSQIMVLIFSSHTNTSGQVRREVERAISRGMMVLPIRIEDVRPVGAMEYALGNTHWLDAFTTPVERHLEKIARSVKMHLGHDVEPEPTEKSSEFLSSRENHPARPRPPWVWAAVALGMVMVGVLGAWIGGAFKARTPEEVVLAKNVPLARQPVPDQTGSPVEAVIAPRNVSLPADLLQPGSIWLSSSSKDHVFTILERRGERFMAKFVVGTTVREITGTIKNGRLKWLAKDVKATAGSPGIDNEGEIKGSSVEMTYSKPGGPVLGRFTLSLKTPAPAVDATIATLSSTAAVSGETAAPFVPLLNGKNLSGWTVDGNPKHTWKVISGGILQGEGPAARDAGPANLGPSNLTTRRQDFTNFHLRLETKLVEGPKKRGAISFRITEHNGDFYKYVANIGGTESGEDDTGSLTFGTATWPPGGTTLANADPVASIEPGEWFTQELIADEDVITIIVKNREVARFKILHRKLTSGAISLLCLPNSKVSFRKIEIKELSRKKVGGPPASRHEAGTDTDLDWGRMARSSRQGDWRIDGGDLLQDNPEGRTWLTFGSPTWTDYTFSADVKIDQSKDNVGLVFRDGGEPLIGEFSYLRTGQYSYLGGPPGVYNGAISLTGKGNLPARRSKNTNLIPGKWHKMRIKVEGHRLTAYLDGAEVMAATDTAKTRGAVGFVTSNSSCRFRNIKVIDFDGKILWEGLPELPSASSFGIRL